jgi:DNA-binding MarR family transcriptional regulator
MSINKEHLNKYLKHRGSYAMIPNEIWEIKELDVYDKTIWSYLCSKKPEWSSSRNNIARNLDLSKDKVSSSIKKLIDYNMLELYEGSNKRWCFLIVTPNHWTLLSATSGPQRLPLVNDEVGHTKEYNNKNKNNFFSKEEEIINYPIGGSRGQSTFKNLHPIAKEEYFESLQSEESEEIYNDLVARGKTPADLNGMSLIEYANQRAYANGFATVDTAKAVEEWKKREFTDWDVEDIIEQIRSN